MPAPTNITALTATDIGALPASTTQNARDGVTTYTLWFKFTPAVDGYVSTWGDGGTPGSGYRPRCTVYEGPDTLPVQIAGGTTRSYGPLQFRVTAGTLYLLKYEDLNQLFPGSAANSNPAMLAVTVLRFTESAILPANPILVPDDSAGLPGAILDPATGVVVKLTSLPAGESAYALRTGYVLTEDKSFGGSLALYLYDGTDLTLVATIPGIHLYEFAVITGNKTSLFYVTDQDAGLVHRIDTTGAIVASFAIPGIAQIAVTPDDTILYYSESGLIKKWDLVNDVSLGTLIGSWPDPDFYTTRQFIVLDDGTLVIGGTGVGGDTTVYTVYRYSAAGTLLNTYTFADASFFADDDQVFMSANDPDTFMVWLKIIHGTTGEAGQWHEVRVSDGALLSTVTSTEYENGIYNGDLALAPVSRFGHSESCPVLTLFGAPAPDVPPAIGPIAWIEWLVSLVTYLYSDQDLQDPGSYYGGFKEARVMRFGDAERALSHLRTGDWTGSTFNLTLSDYDRSIRERLASAIDRYWSEPLTVRMVDLATRAALGTPYTVFVGPIIDARPSAPLAWDLTLGDVVSQGLLSDQAQAPWRRIGDGFLDQLAKVAEGLDLDTPEPIIYGIHLRVPDVDVASGQGLTYAPTYLGIETLGADDWHVWLVAGHACADVTDLRVDTVSKITDEGTSWLVPHHSGWTSLFGVPYVDKRSSTFGNDRRYTLVYGKVTDPGFLDTDLTIDEDALSDPDACALGKKSLTLAIEGVEPVGNGSGAVLTLRLDQYKHFAINFIAHQGQDSYQSGAWLTSPDWTLFDGTVAIVDEASFDACRAIAAIRFPTDGGYTGAGIIGAKAGDRDSLRRWIADWNRSCSTRFGITHLGQLRVVMLHPTDVIKAAAPLFEETNDILKDSFTPAVLWDEHANRIPFKADFNHVTGQWMTIDAATDGISVVGYNRIIVGETREYPFAPGITAASHLATLEVRIARFPPRTVTLETSLGALALLDLGDYIRYRHFASIGDSAGEIRLAQIQRHTIKVGDRRVRIEAIDCDDLIDYDALDIEGAGSPVNESCSGALTFVPGDDGSQIFELDTTNAGTDASLAGGSPALLPDPGVAYHAAWFTFTAPANGNISINTRTSEYDTQIAVLEGTCGVSPMDWTRLGYNDNESPLSTSAVNVILTSGQTIYWVVYGYGPDDGGRLLCQASFIAD